ncbi:hypothetical protein [Xanthomonas oryzae]|uniref:hypothetical protein n=1 Tax=Xanthomonas oryzae TaxID=347 RepID=UPI0006559AB6|nr:hypothetical protein [Xanthomonas oryzae]AKO01051.1 hypothetical protein ACU15_11640 [Xanthomonas oryzae pv. oryzicola]KOR47234.1 hypothetical protein ADT27_08840 [Xanthomonas oryzae]MEC5079000.1 hypothetical protein [Xanthomonas oryzae pv. oryzicola]MEC5112610.1 hypothetical protein [Xanthomonas oryzae pv. oryzicola]OLK85924.1 hypothetical protein BXOR1_18630 [Xanthomonas oryzae pv. oryzicola]
MLAPDFDALESIELLATAGHEPANAPALLAFVAAHIDALSRRLPEESVVQLPRLHLDLCTAEHRAQLYRSRMHALSGGGRNLAQTLESVDICVRARKAGG